MSLPKVSVIIPNWNGAKQLPDCLDSLEQQSFKDFETIVVDNGSKDNSIELLERDYPWVHVIKLERNFGYAGGVNAGIRASKGQYISALNNDTELDAHWLRHLVAALDADPTVGSATPKILNIKSKSGDAEIDATGCCLSVWGLPFARGHGEIDKGQYDKQVEILGADGGACLYRREMLNQIGLLDEAFFIYYEDVDLALRAQLAGWRAQFCPQSRVYHHVGLTSGGNRTALVRYHTSKNMVYLLVKNLPGPLLLKYSPLILFSWIMHFAGSVRHGLLWPQLKSSGAVLAHLPALLRQRQHLQRGRHISIREFDQLLYHHLPPQQRAMLKSYLSHSK